MKRLVILAMMLVALGIAAFASENQLEIFSWWTAGGEHEALMALFRVFHKYYPNVEIINAAVAGGAGTNAKAVLKTRMLGGNPPDSFQVHAGMELIDTYVIPGKMEPITWILEETGALDKFPKDILEICSYKGELYSVPVNVHRGNVVFYNKKLAAKLGLGEPPQTWHGFVRWLRKAKEAGYIGLALGDKNKWTALHLFEDILLAELGPDAYNGLWKGKTSFRSTGVRRALEIMKEMLKYVNSDHAALTWDEACGLVYEGKALCTVMGDWAEGYFKAKGWDPGVEFGWFAVPGTQDAFMVVSDTFGLPKGAPHRKNAIRWLKVIASVEAQDAFNPIKGSIPARLDADRSKYDVYQRWAMDDFATKALCPSIAHGSAAPESFVTELNDIINVFVTTGDVEQAFEDIIMAAEDQGYNTR